MTFYAIKLPSTLILHTFIQEEVNKTLLTPIMNFETNFSPHFSFLPTVSLALMQILSINSGCPSIHNELKYQRLTYLFQVLGQYG